jgi:predicted nucleotidyltransferase
MNHFEPRERLSEISNSQKTELEETLVGFVNMISSTGKIPLSNIGVSGSLLIGAHLETSDIDVHVYGRENSRRAYEALRSLRDALDWVEPLRGDRFDSVLYSRWGDTGLPLEKFVQIEERKVLHGLVNSVEYFVRLLVPDDSFVSRPLGKVSATVKVTNSSCGIYNPCIYKVEPVETDWDIWELKSYRGKFTEQAVEGDLVEVRGTIEEVQGDLGVYHRVVLGGKGDYLLPSLG